MLRYYIFTKKIQLVTIMSGKEKLAKAVKDEEEAFGKLLAQRSLAEELLKNPTRLLSHERVPKDTFTKLQDAVTNYKAALEAVVLAAQEEADNAVLHEQW